MIIHNDAQVDSDADNGEYDNKVPVSAMFNHDTLAFVEIESAVEIGQQALADKPILISVNMTSLQIIKDSGLLSAEKLKSLNLPELLEVESQGLYDLLSLESFSAPKLTTLSSAASRNLAADYDPGLVLDFPLLTTVESNAFKGAAINEIHIESADTINSPAFDGASVDYLYLGTSIPTVPNNDLFGTGVSGVLRILDTVASDFLADTQDGDGNDEYWFGFTLDDISINAYLTEANIIRDGKDNVSFDGDDTDTALTVGYGTESFQLTASVDEDATVTVNDEAFTDGDSFDLDIGSNTYDITVTAEDGSSTITSFTIERESGKTYLMSSSFTTEDLESFFTGVGFDTDDYLDTTGLRISTGTLNNTDLDFIMSNFTNLEDLTITGDADMDGSHLDYTGFAGSDLIEIEMSNLTGIDNDIFLACHSLTSAHFDSVTYVGSGAFQSCTKLYDTSFASLDFIDQEAFADTDSLTSFDFSTGLEEVYMPMADSIGNFAFTSAASLTEITLGAIPPMVGTNAFSALPADRTVKVPAGSYDTYNSDIGSESDGYWYGFVIEEISDDASLSSLAISRYDLTPDFASDTDSYSSTVAYGVSSVDVIAESNSVEADMTINEVSYTSGDTKNISLSVGDNVLTIALTAEDGTTTATYTLTVTREADASSSEQEPIILNAEVQEPIGVKVFDSLQESGKTLQIEGDGFTWTFDGSSEGGGEMSGAFDPGISFIDPTEVGKNIKKNQQLSSRQIMMDHSPMSFS